MRHLGRLRCGSESCVLGGCLGAQGEFIATYLNTLNGFPAPSTATQPVLDGTLDATSLGNVVVFDLTVGAQVPGVVVGYDSGGQRHHRVAPGSPGTWTKGHQYAVVVSGVTGPGGQAVAPSSIFALVSSPVSLLNCADPTQPVSDTNCVSAFTLAPLSPDQPSPWSRSAWQYSAVLGQLGIPGVQAFWTFTITSSPEITFVLDPTAPSIPFPSSFVYAAGADGGPGHVNIPVPDAGSAALIAGLDTLDGFSTTTPIASTNAGPDVDVGNVDPATLLPGSLFVQLGAAGFTPCSPSRMATAGSSPDRSTSA